jgi:hypothetical protein
MYIKNNVVYADAGNILISKTAIGYSLIADIANIQEQQVNLQDMKLEGEFLKYSDGLVVQGYKNLDYAGWKAAVIKWRYTIDDQMAIILNKDESAETLLEYNRMQEWRDWAGTLANKILNINTK